MTAHHLARQIRKYSDLGEFFPDKDTKAFLGTMQRINRWNIYPYGRWLERDGSKTFFDRRYRPICRVPVDRTVEIMEPTVWVDWVKERWLYTGHPEYCPAAKAVTIEIMESYGLEAELRRRRALGRDLPCRA